MKGALLFPMGRPVHDLQHQLMCVDPINNTEDGAVATVSKVFLDVKFIVNASPQQLRPKPVDVRGDEHCFWWSCRGGGYGGRRRGCGGVVGECVSTGWGPGRILYQQ